MAEKTDISWCDSTINLWVGCDKVGPGCDNCYAEKWANRAGTPELWQGKRRRTKTWGDLKKWQKHRDFFFQVHKRRQRVFVNSLSDFLDNKADPAWRADAWEEFKAAWDLELYLVTKRVSNFLKMIPADFGPQYGHIVLIITVVNQQEWDRDGQRLLEIKKKFPWLRVGLSIEPMIGPIDIPPGDMAKLDWIIVGGESGGDNARPMDPNWALSLLRRAQRLGVAFHFKQTGSNHSLWPGKIAGPGKYPAEWPEVLRVREWPKAMAA